MAKVGEIVGRRVREIRARRGLTQAQVAESAGLAVETISRLERGRQAPRIDRLVAVAAALDATVGEIADGAVPKRGHDELPPDVNGLVHLLLGLDADTQRRIRQLVEVALSLGAPSRR